MGVAPPKATKELYKVRVAARAAIENPSLPWFVNGGVTVAGTGKPVMAPN